MGWNYHEDSEATITHLLCVYPSISYYFDCNDVPLRNFAQYRFHQSHEERERAEKRMKLQNQQGGKTFLQDIKKPDRDDWGNALTATECVTLGKKCHSVTAGLAQTGH